MPRKRTNLRQPARGKNRRKSFGCPVRDGHGNRVHGEAPSVVWLQVKPGSEKDTRTVRPWCVECLKADTPEHQTEMILEYYSGPQHGAHEGVVAVSVACAYEGLAASEAPKAKTPRSSRPGTGSMRAYERNKRLIESGETFAGQKPSDYRLGRRTGR